MTSSALHIYEIILKRISPLYNYSFLTRNIVTRACLVMVIAVERAGSLSKGSFIVSNYGVGKYERISQYVVWKISQLPATDQQHIHGLHLCIVWHTYINGMLCFCFYSEWMADVRCWTSHSGNGTGNQGPRRQPQAVGNTVPRLIQQRYLHLVLLQRRQPPWRQGKLSHYDVTRCHTSSKR